jgi:hypothetical protein
MGRENRECLVCSTGFATTTYKNQRYCNQECKGIGRRKPDSEYRSAYRNVSVPLGHPLATPGSRRIPLHRLLLWEAIGPGPHQCARCGTPVDWLIGKHRNRDGMLIADHIDYNTLNNDLSNLRPLCHTCNAAHRFDAITDDEDFYLTYRGYKVRSERRDCELCGTSFVVWPDKRPNRGRFCSRSCARSTPRPSRKAAA